MKPLPLIPSPENGKGEEGGEISQDKNETDSGILFQKCALHFQKCGSQLVEMRLAFWKKQGAFEKK